MVLSDQRGTLELEAVVRLLRVWGNPGKPLIGAKIGPKMWPKERLNSAQPGCSDNTVETVGG
jgi:hypothetical protein